MRTVFEQPSLKVACHATCCLKIPVQVFFTVLVHDIRNLSTRIMVVICQVFLITVMYLFSTFKYGS